MVENGRNNLDCCVVRDLLPAYLEGLTEEETSVRCGRTWMGCENCRELEKICGRRCRWRKRQRGR